VVNALMLMSVRQKGIQLAKILPFSQMDIVETMMVVWWGEGVSGKLSGLFCALLCAATDPLPKFSAHVYCGKTAG